MCFYSYQQTAQDLYTVNPEIFPELYFRKTQGLNLFTR